MPRPTWIPKLMNAMGWPDDPAVSLSLDLWSLSEDSTYRMQNTCHNYIAIIWPPGNKPPWNSFKCGNSTCHVQCYATEDQGVEAHKRFLEQSDFKLIDEAMLAPYKKYWKIENIFLRINGSPACGGCQGGKYPIVLYNWLHGRADVLPSPNLIPNQPPPPSPEYTTIFTAWHDLTLQFRYTVPRELRRIRNARRRLMNLTR